MTTFGGRREVTVQVTRGGKVVPMMSEGEGGGQTERWEVRAACREGGGQRHTSERLKHIGSSRHGDRPDEDIPAPFVKSWSHCLRHYLEHKQNIAWLLAPAPSISVVPVPFPARCPQQTHAPSIPRILLVLYAI